MEANDRDRLDKWLDSALSQYGNVQPRAGLEGRIVANLEARRRVVRRRWALVFAGVAVACAMLVTGWPNKSTKALQTNLAKLSHPSPAIDEMVDQTSTTRALPSRTQRVQQKTWAKVRRAANSDATSRLSQFPSPSPLTDRELTLAKYVAQFPKEAELIAQEQETFEQQMQQAALELRNQNQLSDQER
jgi:hypothetical protein